MLLVKDLFSSKKFIVMLGGIILAIATKLGLPLDPDLANQILAIVAVYIVGQGIADHGKEAAQVNAAASAATVTQTSTTKEGVMPPTVSVTTTTIDPPTPATAVAMTNPPKGFTTFGLIFIMAIVALAVLATGCGPAAECKVPANATTTKCVAVNSVVDCTKGETPAVVAQFGPVISQLIDEATGADGSVDWATVEGKLGSIGTSYGTCVLGSIITHYMVMPRKLAQGEVAPNVNILKAGFSHAKMTLWHLDPETVVHTADGDIR